ncbi:MAG: hypothetical protein H6Q86_4278, partial [candidate division NC10 bacterium]|nr:hypothetical protein [candidate division NC10 bacterium]
MNKRALLCALFSVALGVLCLV